MLEKSALPIRANGYPLPLQKKSLNINITRKTGRQIEAMAIFGFP
jgi:hypothetical protein